MEFEVFGGLEELFSGNEKAMFDSFLDANNIGILVNNVSKTNNPSADVLEQVSNDGSDEEMVDTDLDNDLDEVMENFLKRSQESEQISVEMITENDDNEDLDSLMDNFLKESQESEQISEEITENDENEYLDSLIDNFLKESQESELMITDEDDEAFTAAALLDLEQHLVVQHGGNIVVILDDDDDEEEEAVVEAVPGGFMPSQSGVRPSPWNSLTTPPSSFSSSSSSPSFSDAAGGNRPCFLLGGLVDIRSLETSSWNNLHVSPLGQPSNSSSSSTSPSPPAPVNIPGGVDLLQPCPGSGISSSQPNSSSENVMKNGSSAKPPRGRKRKEADPLPEEWECVKRVRQNGKSKGQVDKYYLNKITKQRVRSLPELRRLLNLSPDGLEATTATSD